MDIFEKYGIVPYINAHDTYTVYGGSCMSATTLQAMQQVSKSFVDMEQLQRVLGAHLAAITHNEAAYVSNGASGGLLTAAAVCMAKDDPYKFSCLPDTSDVPNEIIVMRAQRNAYDAAITAAGAKIVEVGDADETLAYLLRGSINSKTAAIFFFVSTLYQRGSLPLEQTIAIAQEYKIPVIVDAAAQLPPVENLWNFTKMGADMVIFSGGKTLCGPQDSGLILGKKEWIERCIRFGAPAHGVCRSSKVSREAMVGLCNAVEEYLQKDFSQEEQRLHEINDTLEKIAQSFGLETKILSRGPVGQTYPRLYIQLPDTWKAQDLVQQMKKRNVYVGHSTQSNGLYLSPLNIREWEILPVQEALKQVLKDALKKRAK